MNNNYPKGYGVFMQDGGQMQNGMSADEQMMAEQEMAAQQGQAPAEDPQAIAEQFLQAFSQLPPEAQQMIAQAITQQ